MSKQKWRRIGERNSDCLARDERRASAVYRRLCATQRAALLQLIFSGEYTKAMNADWHS